MKSDSSFNSSDVPGLSLVTPISDAKLELDPNTVYSVDDEGKVGSPLAGPPADFVAPDLHAPPLSKMPLAKIDIEDTSQRILSGAQQTYTTLYPYFEAGVATATRAMGVASEVGGVIAAVGIDLTLRMAVAAGDRAKAQLAQKAAEKHTSIEQRTPPVKEDPTTQIAPAHTSDITLKV